MSDIEDGGRTKPSSPSPPPPQLSSSPSPSRLAKILVSSLACRQFLAFVSFVPALSDFMGLAGHSWSSPARYFAQRAPKSCAGSVLRGRSGWRWLSCYPGWELLPSTLFSPTVANLLHKCVWLGLFWASFYVFLCRHHDLFSPSPVSLCIICKFLECTVRMRDWWRFGLVRNSVRDPDNFSPIAISYLLK